MFYFKFHIGDYRTDTQHLTLLEHGVYMTLMATYYSTEKPLPKDERQLFRLAGARTDEEKQAVIDVVNEFFNPTETHWVSSRIDFELSEYHSKAEANRENGKKGGRPKKNPPKKPINNPSGFDSVQNKTQMDSETKPIDNPNITLTNKPINPLTNEPINQYKYTFDLNFVNANLQKAGKGIVDQKYIDELQPQFELYYADQHMVNNKALVKFVQWIMRNQEGKAKPQYQSSQQKTEAEMDKWKNFTQSSNHRNDPIDVTPDQQFFIEN